MTIEIDGLSLEPLPRISITDPGGMDTWRKHWEKGRYSNGEIISGVQRNYQRFIDLETDYQAADGAITSAYIAADALVASDAESARAALEIDLTAAYEADDTAISANVSINAGAIADVEGGAAYFEVVAAASGSDPARFGLKNGKDGSLFVVDADQIWFGSQTVFDTSSETFITEVGGIRSRYGTAFGASSDLIRWDGPTSVDQGDETRTNGYMAIGTNGLIYHNSAALDWGATAAEAAASNALLPLGVNRVAYPRGEAGTRGWGEYNPSSLSSSIAQVKFAGRVGQKATVTATAFGQIYDLQAGSDSDYRIPVAPNERICVAVALEAANVNSGYVYVNWTDVSGAYISNATAFSWVGDLSFVTEKFGFLTAPANAAGCYIDFFVYAQAAGTLQLSVVDFRLCAVSSSQSVAPPFTPGRTFETAADVTGDHQAADVAPGAVTNTASASTDGSITLTAHTWVTVQSKAFTTTGGSIFVAYNAVPYVTTTTSISPIIQARVLRGATTVRSIHTTHFPSTNSDGSQQVGGAYSGFLIDAPSAATYTYYLQLKATTAGGSGTLFSSTAEFRSLYLTEFKR